MNLFFVLHLVSLNLILFSFFLILPLIVSLLFQEKSFYTFLKVWILTLLTGILGYFLTKKAKKEDIGRREAFLVVTLTWIVVAFFGSLTYLWSGVLKSFTDAYFEAMSGFTTTGSSVFTQVENLPYSILFWRALTQWIGGLGIVVFVLAILPWLGSGGMQLFKAEVPEITPDKLKPRIIDTAKLLWKIYIGITIFLVLAYLISGMNLFDAICHTFTTISTGGFSTKNESIGHFKKPWLEYVVCLGMLMGGTNFTIYYYIIKKDFSKLKKNTELKVYFLLIISFIVLNTLFLKFFHALNWEKAFRVSSFQIISIITTTGYGTEDYLKWPYVSQVLLLFSMFFGGMIGSTAGGIKMVRIVLVFKYLYKELYQLLHPKAVISIKLNGNVVSESILESIWGFIFLLNLVTFIATLILASTGLDPLTAFSTVVTTLNNVGPAFGEAGPTGNFSFIHPLGKWTLILCMLIGRLEYYTVILLFFPAFWKK